MELDPWYMPYISQMAAMTVHSVDEGHESYQALK